MLETLPMWSNVQPQLQPHLEDPLTMRFLALPCPKKPPSSDSQRCRIVAFLSDDLPVGSAALPPRRLLVLARNHRSIFGLTSAQERGFPTNRPRPRYERCLQ